MYTAIQFRPMVAVALLLPAVLSSASTKYGGGSGTARDPYLIATVTQMNAIGADPNDWSRHFRLMADLDLSAFDGKSDRTSFHVIGTSTPSFTGVFDGNGHTLSNLTITGGSLLGVFGQLASSAQVKNLGLVNLTVTSSGKYVGGLVGDNRGSVSRCYSAGTVRGQGGITGGLVGGHYGTLTDCYSNASVSGYGAGHIGGLVGYNWGTVTRCYSTGVVGGSASIGGLVGTSSGGVVTGSFWDTKTSRRTQSAGGVGLVTADLQTAQTFRDAGWDLENTWILTEGVDYPRLRPPAATSQDAGLLPLALAFISEQGKVMAGTPNVRSTFNSMALRYEITLQDETYAANQYVAVVTLSGTSAAAVTDSVDGKLVVNIYNGNGDITTSAFQVIIYKYAPNALPATP